VPRIPEHEWLDPEADEDRRCVDMSLKLGAASSNELDFEPTEVAWMPFVMGSDNQGQSRDRMRTSKRGLTSPCIEDLAQAERYQVALIPLPGLMRPADKAASGFTDLESVLVLPLTWKDVLIRLRSHDPFAKSRQTGDVVSFGATSVQLSSMEIHRAGKRIPVTALEFKLLRYLLLNAGRVISRDELLNEVWGFDNYPCTRTIDTHMWRLRQKLESDPTNPSHFLTIHAMGYKFLP
jgi:DNA-binding response OmpR family regulator